MNGGVNIELELYELCLNAEAAGVAKSSPSVAYTDFTLLEFAEFVGCLNFVLTLNAFLPIRLNLRRFVEFISLWFRKLESLDGLPYLAIFLAQNDVTTEALYLIIECEKQQLSLGLVEEKYVDNSPVTNKINLVSEKVELDKLINKHGYTEVGKTEEGENYGMEIEMQEIKLEELPPSLDISVADVSLLGKVSSHFLTEKNSLRLIVQGHEKNWVDINTLVCSKDLNLIGRVEEIFGQVEKPFYSVRVQNEKFTVMDVSEDLEIFTVKEFEKRIDEQELENEIKMRGREETYIDEVEDNPVIPVNGNVLQERQPKRTKYEKRVLPPPRNPPRKEQKKTTGLSELYMHIKN
eukprot:maker-scaffold_20-snap-gene-4.46-mRNA-1 protein AED:0.21 eAED:0.21 QI:655/1/0.5/1/0/0/2/0/349